MKEVRLEDRIDEATLLEPLQHDFSLDEDNVSMVEDGSARKSSNNCCGSQCCSRYREDKIVDNKYRSG
jgi:hypothetical protein